MNGAGVVTPPPKTAPKPRAKPTLPRRATSDALPVPAAKPTKSSKPPPVVAQKPKPGQAPVVSPKPPPLESSRPRSVSAGATPSSGTAPAVTNGGTPPPVAFKPKPKPPLKRKSWIASPQQCLDLKENTGTTEAISEEKSTPASEESVCDQTEISPQDKTEKEEPKCVISESIDHNSSSPEESRESSGDADSNQISQSTDDVLRNSDPANLESHAPNDELGHRETLKSNSIDNTAATPSDLPVDTSVRGEDSSEVPSPQDNESINNDSSPKEDALETSITQTCGTSASGSADDSPVPDTDIVPDSDSPAAVQDSLNNLSASSDVTANSIPTYQPENQSVATDPTSCDDDDDAFEETEDSTKEESVEFTKPPVPAPRRSLSSVTSDVTSEVSSLDSYDFLNRSRGGSSFKSQKSQSVRSQGSSRLGSDSEDECGVFEVQPEIAEEDEEEAEETRVHAETSDPDEKDNLKGQNSSISDFGDLQEKEGHIAENDEDIVLVSLTAAAQGNTEVEEDTKAKENDQVVPLQEHSSIQEPTVEQSKSSSAVVEGQGDNHIALQKDTRTPENTDDPSNAEIEVGETTIGEYVDLAAEDIHVPVSSSEELEINQSGVSQEIEKSKETKGQEQQELQEREDAKEELAQELTEEGRGASEEEEESEEEFDEMGKRVFSLSRKKKPGVLKYSSGEFHEQYEASGKEKAVSENSKSKDSKKKPKKDPKKGKKEVAEENSSVIENVHSKSAAVQEDQGATSEEDRPSKPPRMRPGATPEELEVGRASTTSDVSTTPLEGEVAVRPLPAPRSSVSRSFSRPKISLSHRVRSVNVESDEDDESSLTGDMEVASGAEDDASREEHIVNGGGAGAVVTRVDSDGEEEVFIGGMPSSSMCTQTAFVDQTSIALSADEPTEMSALQQGNNPQQFRHFATIEPVGNAALRSPSVEVPAGNPTLISGPADTLSNLSENQSVAISITESEPLSDSAECLSQRSEHAINKPWSEVAAVTVSVTTMPEPLVPQFTRVEGDSSTSSSSSSLVPCQPIVKEPRSLDSSQDDDEDNDDDDDNRNMYDKIDIYDAGYKKKDWKYRETDEELRMSAQPDPENDAEADEAKDTISHLSESSSLATTASEQEFKSSFGERPHRIQRRRGSEDFVRLSRISRERTITLRRQDGTYGLRIQKSKPVVITTLDPGGAAENAGLKVGDMVIKVNGQDVRQVRHSEVVKIATEAPEPLVIVVGTVVCNSLNIQGDHTIMSGFMHKMANAGPIKQWRKRWFVLKHDNCLYFYKTENDKLPQGAIVLQNYTVTKARDAGKQFSFKLTKEGARTYVFYTANEEEMSSWGKAINDAANPSHKTDVWLDISTHNVSLPALSIKDPECNGFLTKWNGKMKNARRRFCVLKDACLYYYKEMDALDAQGVVHLHGYSIQESELKGKKFAFILKPPDEELREFYFFADHDTDRKRWVAALASSIGRWISTNNPDDGEDEGTEMYI
ncbi:titin homolog [Strongylocentrotus purpuratus]|uniref:Uncharacterized protein n=1 Tax=Strongylocentrotus purpuratus TaxID=7668 RepID=A0A7M7STF9_STRPU|nr:titin homolog [Strongylocentrotus purpuratus]